MRGKRPALPGSPGPQSSDVDSMIRVDHAGEFGALRIYEGQLAVLSRNPNAAASTAIQAAPRNNRGAILRDMYPQSLPAVLFKGKDLCRVAPARTPAP